MAAHGATGGFVVTSGLYTKPANGGPLLVGNWQA
jgi:hypothetical protein